MAPVQAAAFGAFASSVAVRWDERFLYVESDGLPAHGMMIGITAWQQQVPLPQPYRGGNTWRIPLRPVPAKTPVAIKGRFLRGAVALAANGVPIFNPQNNRGEISLDIGELDQWGGHCGRSDDYHYHIAPLHLQAVLGPAKPIAYALDGYAIYGLTEPDGARPEKLDAYNGHDAAGLGYHYHASLKYPFVNGGFHGEVVEREGQVDPQPRAQGVRPALTALRGAKITDFKSVGDRRYELTYSRGDQTNLIRYVVGADGGADFEFRENGETRFQSYKRRSGGGGQHSVPFRSYGEEQVARTMAEFPLSGGTHSLRPYEHDPARCAPYPQNSAVQSWCRWRVEAVKPRGMAPAATFAGGGDASKHR
jgi:hypothetical protein